MSDHAIQFFCPQTRLQAVMVITTESLQQALKLQDLDIPATVALGRLMSGAALTNIHDSPQHSMSMQIMSPNRISCVFVDIDAAGSLRGYVQAKFPGSKLLRKSHSQATRLHVSQSLAGGQLSVIRQANTAKFSQSTTELHSGEVDEDIAHYLTSSHQIQTLVQCDVLFEKKDTITHCVGILIQKMPDTPQSAFDSIKAKLEEENLASRFAGIAEPDLKDFIRTLMPAAEVSGPPTPLQWQCRCSAERVCTALGCMAPEELADMVDKKESAEMTCEFCHTTYVLNAAKVSEIFQDICAEKDA